MKLTYAYVVDESVIQLFVEGKSRERQELLSIFHALGQNPFQVGCARFQRPRPEPFRVRPSTRSSNWSMSFRFCWVSWVRTRSPWTYSKSCFNTVNSSLNFFHQISVDASLNLAPFRSFACQVPVDGPNFGEVLVHSGQVFHVRFASAISGNRFCPHDYSLSACR